MEASVGTMTIKKFFYKIFFIDLLKGLSVTLREMFTHAVTEQYPKERSYIYECFRGEPRMMVDEDGKTLCIACGLCAIGCPEQCITVKRERDPETKKNVLTEYIFDMRRCLFCGFCEEVCPTNCIQLTTDYEMAQYDLQEFVLDLPHLEEGMVKITYKK